MRKAFVRAVLCGAAAFGVVVGAPLAQAKGVTRDEFSFPTEGRMKIAVFRPDVHVGAMRVGGLDETNAEWTQAARENMQKALEAAGEARASDMIFLGDLDGPNAEVLNRYRGLFEAVSGEIVSHQFLFDRLPTKLAPPPTNLPQGTTPPKRYKLDWTLGPDAKALKAVTGADYALFLFTHDAYGDAGRKVAQFLMAGLFGVYMPAGVHIGYAGLVDLNTGNIVWFNTDLAMGGDVRVADGATKRVGQLLAGLPTREVTAEAAKTPPSGAAPAAATPAKADEPAKSDPAKPA